MFSSFFSSSANSSLAAFQSKYDISSCSSVDLGSCKFYGAVKSKGSDAASAVDGSDDGGEVSVFVWEGAEQRFHGQKCIKRLKTLRHPAVLKYVADGENETTLMLATEKAEAMVSHLERMRDDEEMTKKQMDLYLSWGIYQVLRGVAFLNVDAKLRHNNLHGDAIYVNAAGDWKLFGFEIMDSVESGDFVQPSSPALQKYAAPEVTDLSKRRAATPHSRDMWGIGCVLWEAFNGILPAARNLGQLGDIPSGVSQLYKELVAANPAKRPNPKEKLEAMRRSGGYFKNELIDAIVFLEELQIKEESEKGRFYQNIGSLLDNFPRHVGTRKILPELIKAFEFSNAGAAILGPVLKLGKGMSDEEYVRRIVPCIVKLFASSDRNARYKLLNQVETFVEHLDAKVVNEQVFPQLQSGFVDQEPVIREKTVIAMIHLSPKLNQSNLDDVAVMKHFSRLLRDEQAGIRTNTTVCLGKIAKYMQFATRQKVLIPAFTGKLRDPFPPCRIASINALAATQSFYTLAETGTKVLPAICTTLTDPEEPVRKQGFKVARGFIDKLQQVSDDPSLKEEMEAEVQKTYSEGAGSTLSSAAGWASWAMGAVGAKFYKSSIPPPSEQQSQNSRASSSSPQPAQQPSSQQKRPEEKEHGRREQRQREESKLSEPSEGLSNAATDGWGDADEDDWGSLEESFKATKLEDEPLKPVPVSTQRRSTTKQTENDTASDWNSWEEPSTSFGSSQENKDEERLLREEKRRQRRAEMEAKKANRKGGPLKLGAKKMAVD